MANERLISACDAFTGRGYAQGGPKVFIRGNHLPIDDCDTKLDRSQFLVIVISINVNIRLTSLGRSLWCCWWGPKQVADLPYTVRSSVFNLDSEEKNYEISDAV
jgi:hypothetical protein